MRSVVARRLTSTALAIAISALVLWWLLGDGEMDALINAVRTANPWPLALGALIAIGIQMIRAWRFALLTTGDLTLPSWSMIGIASRLVLLNFLLPFKLGELGFPLMMKRVYGTPFGQGAGILILCRLLDLGVVAGMILLGAAWLLAPEIHGLDPVLLSALGVLAILSPILIVDILPLIRRLTSKLPRLQSLAEPLSIGALSIRPPGRRAFAAILTMSIWLAHALIAGLTAYAIGADLGFSPMAMASAASNLAFALPISGVAGLGPPQAAWATVLNLQGVDWTPAITSALICHGVLLITLSIWGLATWVAQAAGVSATVGASDVDRHSASL